MRPISFALLCCVVACGPSGPHTQIDAVTVGWMDWPAEVNAGQPFRTRMIVSAVCALNPRFYAGSSADFSAVTFAPYFKVDDDHIACFQGTTEILVSLSIDTAGTAPGLPAVTARSYEMRAAAWPPLTTVARSIPVRTFGAVVVRPTGESPDPSRRNAAGQVYLQRDSLGCARIRPVGVWAPQGAMVLEDQADTLGVSGAFVQGYIHDASVTVCGETRVFRLVARVSN
jgi:hypothetical protein